MDRGPGHVMVNTWQFEKRTTLDIETTAYHEGVPGHHMQLSIAQELPTLPTFRQHGGYIAYIEGWALYSERLGKELGFSRIPTAYYGHLQDDLLRAIRLVVDTGFHYKKWTREQVIDYFRANSAPRRADGPERDGPVHRLARRRRSAYKIGQLKILELRDRAKKELGPRFDIRGFHDEVLGGGAMPLDILDQRLAAWTARNRQAAATGSSLR